MEPDERASTEAVDQRGPAPSGVHVLVRVWLQDRPGALGLVASRIGAARGDIVGIDVLERGDRVALDEFAVALPDREHLPMMVREIQEVDGTSVEEVRIVGHFPDPRLDALLSAARICDSESLPELHRTLVGHVRAELLADWCALLAGRSVLASDGGPVPPPALLEALATGAGASPAVADGRAGPDDLAVAGLAAHGSSLLVVRGGHPFRRRERAQLLAVARVADRVSSLLEARAADGEGIAAGQPSTTVATNRSS
jgi:hypothetical protein